LYARTSSDEWQLPEAAPPGYDRSGRDRRSRQCRFGCRSFVDWLRAAPDVATGKEARAMQYALLIYDETTANPPTEPLDPATWDKTVDDSGFFYNQLTGRVDTP